MHNLKMIKKTEKQSIGNKIAHGINKAIAVVSPKKAAEREMYLSAFNEMQALSSPYRGTSRDRFSNDWLPGSSSADQDMLSGTTLESLRARSRDLNRNNPYAASITDTTVTNTVGTGIRPQSRPRAEVLGISPDQVTEFQSKAEAIFKKWMKFADAGSRLNFLKMQALVDRQIIENGEIFLIPIMMDKAKYNRPYSFAYQLVEADRVDTPNDKKSDKNVRKGIEIGEFGQPVAYHISTGFPGDWKYQTYNRNKKFKRYDAVNSNTGYKNVLHLYDMKRPDQSRGLPLCTPVIEFFQHLDKYLHAEIISARIAACFSIFIKKSDPMAALNNINVSTDSDGNKIEKIKPGMVEYLGPGEEVESFNPARPGQTFDQFTTTILRMIAAGVQLPYELVQKNFSKSNYSNMRAALLQAYKYFRTRQQFLGDGFCTPTWGRVIEEAYLLGEIDAPNFYEMKDEWLRVTWIADGWEWVDPLKETKAAVEGKKANIITLSDICGARGQDWEELLEQQAREKAKIKALEEKYGIKFDEEDLENKLSEQEKPIKKPDEEEEDEDDEDN